MAPVSKSALTPEFPSWPLNCLTFYLHLADDYARYLQALSRCADPTQAARAEGDYGTRLMRDLTQAWYELALSPLTAMAKTVTSASAKSG